MDLMAAYGVWLGQLMLKVTPGAWLDLWSFYFQEFKHRFQVLVLGFLTGRVMTLRNRLLLLSRSGVGSPGRGRRTFHLSLPGGPVPRLWVSVSNLLTPFPLAWVPRITTFAKLHTSKSYTNVSKQKNYNTIKRGLKVDICFLVNKTKMRKTIFFKTIESFCLTF